jgi:hypothetical protein
MNKTITIGIAVLLSITPCVGAETTETVIHEKNASPSSFICPTYLPWFCRV